MTKIRVEFERGGVFEANLLEDSATRNFGDSMRRVVDEVFSD